MTRRNTDVGRRVTTAGVSLVVISVTVIMMGMGVLAAGCADPAPEASATSDVVLSSQLPSGYALQLDRANRDRADFAVRDDHGDLIVETGPAGILYRPDDAGAVSRETRMTHATGSSPASPSWSRSAFLCTRSHDSPRRGAGERVCQRQSVVLQFRVPDRAGPDFQYLIDQGEDETNGTPWNIR